jgi:hypothetical protein
MNRFVLLALLFALPLAHGQPPLPPDEVHLHVGEVKRVDVYRAVGLNCDDLEIIEAKLVTSKDKTHNTLVIKGKAEGSTYCRAGQAVLGQNFLIKIVVEEPGD